MIEQGQIPFALLGMSFLNRMEMRREGQTMVLTSGSSEVGVLIAVTIGRWLVLGLSFSISA